MKIDKEMKECIIFPDKISGRRIVRLRAAFLSCHAGRLLFFCLVTHLWLCLFALGCGNCFPAVILYIGGQIDVTD